MNFKVMPELGWRWAIMRFGVMIGLGVLMLLIFKRKKWIP